MKNDFMIVVPSYEYNFCAKEIPITPITYSIYMYFMYLIAGKIETTKIEARSYILNISDFVPFDGIFRNQHLQ